MEVFVRDLAYQANYDDVITALAQNIHRPPFADTVNFSFQRFSPKGNRPSGIGKITFPTNDSGQLFLSIFGTSGITISGRTTRFTLSKKGPDMALVSKLLSTNWEDPVSIQMKKERLRDFASPIQLESFSFGRSLLDELFVSDPEGFGKGFITCSLETRQIRLQIADNHPPNTDNSPFSSANMFSFTAVFSSLFADGAADKIHATYKSPQIKNVLCSSINHRSVVLRSQTPPAFESHTSSIINILSNRNQQIDRRASINAERGFQSPLCYSLYLIFQTDEDRDTFTARCRNLGIIGFRSIDRDITVTPWVPPSEALANQISNIMVKLPFPLGFEIEKAMELAYIDPAEVVCLEAEIKELSRVYTTLAAPCFKYFASTRAAATNVPPFYRKRQRKHGRTQRNDNDPRNSIATIDIKEQLFSAIQTFEAEIGAKKSLPRSPGVFDAYQMIITPSSRILEGPLVNQSNGVLRRFKRFDCFIRVAIQEENRGKIRREPGLAVTQLLRKRFMPILLDGFILTGRRFQFLGWSMSGLRGHSVWFVCPFTGEDGTSWDAESIRSYLGDFSGLIYEPARLAARWAQGFSATHPTVQVDPSQVCRIKDRESSTGSCFTDGCGTISPELSKEVWGSLRQRKVRHFPEMKFPSAYQFRLGGAKGMLVVDPNLKGKILCLRPSQIKFEAPKRLDLDIQSTSFAPKAVFLNRPLVLILEHLGVNPDYVMKLQTAAVHEVQTSRSSLQAASKFLSQHSIGASFRLPSLLRNIKNIIQVDISNELATNTWRHPLIDGSLFCAATHALREIKFRCHIYVPGSVTLLGVSDEHDCLEEGEIYATVWNPCTGSQQHIEGPVLITRSPQVHPGDVQMVQAVQPRKLLHLKNVVVFSCRGQRSLSSCLGGGDLDGDDYNLILDPQLHPPKICIPGAYTPLPRTKTEKPCTVQDVAEFFINYIESDLIGLVSILYLRIADISPEGPACDDCIKLAEAASHAVDFPKTGTPVKMVDLPRSPSNLKPDFLAPEAAITTDSSDYYPSKKVLGRLFRSVPEPKPREMFPVQDLLDCYQKVNDELKAFSYDDYGLPTLGQPSKALEDEMNSMLNYFLEQFQSISRVHTVSKLPDARLSEQEVFSGVILAKWSDARQRREAMMTMNVQTQELAKYIRSEIRRTDEAEEQIMDAMDIEEDEEDTLDSSKLGIILQRAWAAWIVSEDAVNDNPADVGAQSFGLLALGILLDVINAAKYPDQH